MDIHHLTVAVFYPKTMIKQTDVQEEATTETVFNPNTLIELTDVQEEATTEVELLFKCYWQFVCQKEELASLVFILTKSVALIPYKYAIF